MHKSCKIDNSFFHDEIIACGQTNKKPVRHDDVSWTMLAGVKHVKATRECRYRVFRKNCVFFTIHCNPCLAYISVRHSKLSTKCECTVTPIGW